PSYTKSVSWQHHHTHEAYNSENQYFTREDYTYNYDLLNAI
ncbi:hypothetical protein, partial [Escherichia coli]